ncbi:MAG: glycosyltransferase family 4 protein [Clostridium sp.]
MKILFIHNTAADYRIPFFKMLAEKIDIKFCFTRLNLSKEVYGNDINKKELDKLDYISVNSLIELIRVCFKEEYDGVFVPSMDSFKEYLQAIIAILISKIRGKKSFYFTEKWEPRINLSRNKRIKNYIRLLLTKGFIKSIDSIVCSGSKAKEYITESVGVKDRCYIAYDASEMGNNPITKNIRKDFNIETKYVILYYGRIIKRKGLDILIRAFKDIEEENCDCTLIVAGDGDYKNECEELASSLNINKIKFVGYVHPNYRRDYFSQSDIFVLPSINHEGTIEAWGLTVNEAMSEETVVISTNAVGASFDMIVDDENGFIVEENNVSELSLAMKSCLNDDFKLSTMKMNAKQTFENDFNYEAMVNSFYDCIIKTLE